MRTEGRHMVVEVSGCNPDVLNDLDRVKEILRESALQANAEILNWRFTILLLRGVSGVVVISESHLSIHTWPEYGYAALDVYTCEKRPIHGGPWSMLLRSSRQRQSSRLRLLVDRRSRGALEYMGTRSSRRR